MDPKALINIVLPVLTGSLTAYIAKQRGRDMMLWFVLGVFFFILPLMVLFFLPAVDTDAKGTESTSGQKKAMTGQFEPVSVSEADAGANKWFYLDAAHKQYGPVSFSLLKELWKEKTLTEATYLWQEGMGGWKQIKDLSYLLQLFKE